MEMADYERLVKDLNLQLSDKERLLEEQERQTEAQREREEKLNMEIGMVHFVHEFDKNFSHAPDRTK